MTIRKGSRSKNCKRLKIYKVNHLTEPFIQYDAQSVFANEFDSPQFTSGGFSDLDYAINEEVDFDEDASIFSTAPFTVNNVLTTTSEPRTLPALEITTTLAEMFQESDKKRKYIFGQL